MTARRSYIYAGLFLAAILAWLASGLIGRDEGDAPGQTAAHDSPTAVRVRDLRSVERSDILVVLGRTMADRAVTLRAETAGRVAAIGAKRGDKVAQGEMIARLDLGDRSARLAEARAQVERRRLEWQQASRLAQRDFASRNQVAETKAALEEAEARLAAIQEEIDDTVIRAPFAGILDDRMVEMGDYLAVGDKVATVLDLDPITVAAQVPETSMHGVAEGLEGQAVLTDGRAINGAVAYVSSAANPDTRTFRLELEADNADGAVPAGMTAELRVARPGSAAHHVPASALTLDDDGRIGLKVVESGDVVRFLPVRVLGEDGKGVWVAGLPPQVRVVTVGQEWVASGQKVAAKPEDGQ